MNTIKRDNSIVLIIDVQEKLVNMLDDNTVSSEAVKVAKAAGILNIPTIITEQYPKGLGATIPEIKNAVPNAEYIEKTSFSALKEEALQSKLNKLNKKQIIIFGIETHICVLQTVSDLLNQDYEVFIVENSCGSRSEKNKEWALKRLMHMGAQVVTTEMVIFELLETSKHPNFKEVQAIIK